jgi:hypothetical protein
LFSLCFLPAIPRKVDGALIFRAAALLHRTWDTRKSRCKWNGRDGGDGGGDGDHRDIMKN